MSLQRVIASCKTCGKEWTTKNAHGVGAKHAKHYGHEVVVEKEFKFVYNESVECTNIDLFEQNGMKI